LETVKGETEREDPTVEFAQPNRNALGGGKKSDV
jgi:hypothetical protein